MRRRYLPLAALPALCCGLIALAAGGFFAYNALFIPHPAVVWDVDPNTLILSVDTCCGMLYEPNGIPDARLWGDGQLIWLEYDSHGARRVLVDILSPDEITNLLQSFVNAGFFGWKDYYEPSSPVYDAPSSCIQVNLKSESKSVCDLMGKPPRDFYELYDYVASGAGQLGGDYAPTSGYLSATPSGPPTNTVPTLNWPAESLGLSLRDAANGAWIEGESLALAWRIVNANPSNPIVLEDDTFYSLILLIPDVTRQQPP
ncbi:MAG TPA: hypothetical protein VI547_01315 [Anaerolineales bacterium]|nr:hypothetical protein [Anaerolineales bacterium]